MPSAPKLYILAELLKRVGCPLSAALPWWLPHHDTPQCHHNPQLRIEVCQMLGVPLPIEKVELPTTALKFLRMLLDITNMGVHLPVDKHHLLLGQQKHSYKARDSLLGESITTCCQSCTPRAYICSLHVQPELHIRTKSSTLTYCCGTYSGSWNRVSFLKLAEIPQAPDLMV